MKMARPTAWVSPDSGVGFARSTQGCFSHFICGGDLLFLSHFNFLQLVMCQDVIGGCKRHLL
jgi:hypothetical protein